MSKVTIYLIIGILFYFAVAFLYIGTIQADKTFCYEKGGVLVNTALYGRVCISREVIIK